MNAKEYLSQIVKRDKEITKMLERLKDLRSISTKATACYGREFTQRFPEKDTFEKVMVKIIDLEREIDEKIDVLVDYKIEAVDLISRVEEIKCRAILRLKYVEYKSWADISYELGISNRWVLKLHGMALENFNNLLKSTRSVHC